jgi:oxygen-independent coproporphyrinogen-3 oxidase
MQLRCQARLAEAGYAQYEVSAYARPGRQCAHNLNYWRFGDYLGIGAGAHGKLTLPSLDGPEGRILRRWKVKHPAAYLANAGTPAAIGADEVVLPAARPFEFMLNALRLREGFTVAMFEARTGLPFAAIRAPLAQAADAGWLEERDGHIRPTDAGLRFANDVMTLFLDDAPDAGGAGVGVRHGT